MITCTRRFWTFREKRIAVGSLDVKALYPSLDIDFTVDVMGEMYEDSDIRIDGIDYEEMGLYLAYNMSREELAGAGIENVCPTRRSNRRPPVIQAAGIREDKVLRFAPWIAAVNRPTEQQKKRMVIESIKIAVSLIMKNHVYNFNNVIYKQESGGPIGLNLTGTIAQVFMLWWDKKFKDKLKQLGVEVLLYKRYVDDINMCTVEIEEDVRYENGQVIRSERNGTIDPGDARTFELIRRIGDDVHESVELEVDYASKHGDAKVPILDVKMYVSDGRNIIYEFYMKDVSSKCVINARSAAPLSMKRMVLTQEILRVILNCSPDLEWEVKKAHIENMVARMQYSGYNKKFRGEVVNSAMKAYHKILRSAQAGERPIHRPKTWKWEEREKLKIAKKKNWYTKGGYDSVMFLPTTPGSELKKSLQQEINRSEFKVKIVETTGKTVKQHLQRSDPFRGVACGRRDCPVCTSGGHGRCDKHSVLYRITCLGCGSTYHGETGRSAYSRTREHAKKLEDSDEENSQLWKHCVHNHHGERQEFRYDVVQTFTNDAMLRQISESVCVSRTRMGASMNGKMEWNQPRVPRAVVE